MCAACIFHSLLFLFVRFFFYSLLPFHFVASICFAATYTDRFILIFCLVVDHSISFHGLVCILRVVSHILSVRQYKPSNSDNRKELPRFWSTKFVYIFFRITLCLVFFCFFAPLFCARFRFAMNILWVRKQIELIILSETFFAWFWYTLRDNCVNINNTAFTW